MMFACLLLIFVFGGALCGRSPNANRITQIFEGGTYPSDIIEDSELDTVGLIQKYGYPAEIHHVETEDGYILEMHRIPHGIGEHKIINSTNKPVAFLMHGALTTSSDWILVGPGKSLAYLLADEGYDVWMGNARGNYYSRNHKTLDPNGLEFWQFSFYEVGFFDVAAMIDEVLVKTSKKQLHYVGHSQGTTNFWVLMSTRPEYNAKIKSMQALAPVAYMGNVYTPFYKYFGPYFNGANKILKILGYQELLPSSKFRKAAALKLCSDTSLFQPICYNSIFLATGFDIDQLNKTILPVILGHMPAGTSSKTIAHFSQSIQLDTFSQFNYGIINNLIRYGTFHPPQFELELITAPVALHYSDNDWVVSIKDLNRLFDRLARPIGKFLVQFRGFNHMDFMFAIDVKILLYDRVINLIKAFE